MVPHIVKTKTLRTNKLRVIKKERMEKSKESRVTMSLIMEIQ